MNINQTFGLTYVIRRFNEGGPSTPTCCSAERKRSERERHERMRVLRIAPIFKARRMKHGRDS